jgi:hypothetical protein
MLSFRFSCLEVLRVVGVGPPVVEGQVKAQAVTLSGPVAVVSNRWQVQGTYKGERFTDDQRCGQTWLQTAGAWQLVSEHCVQIASEPPAPFN